MQIIERSIHLLLRTPIHMQAIKKHPRAKAYSVRNGNFRKAIEQNDVPYVASVIAQMQDINIKNGIQIPRCLYYGNFSSSSGVPIECLRPCKANLLYFSTYVRYLICLLILSFLNFIFTGIKGWYSTKMFYVFRVQTLMISLTLFLSLMKITGFQQPLRSYYPSKMVIFSVLRVIIEMCTVLSAQL